MTQNKLSDVLKERGERYGTFMDNANYAQLFKTIAHSAPQWNNLKADQREAIDNIMQKIARALTGNPDYDDNWIDIAGYSQLVVNRLAKDAEAKNEDK